MFLVLGLFVATAVLSWCCRRSPWAKRVKEQRRRAASGDPEKTVLDSYAKMSRRQQKSFAMQATVALLQQSRVSCVRRSGDGGNLAMRDAGGFVRAPCHGRAWFGGCSNRLALRCRCL